MQQNKLNKIRTTRRKLRTRKKLLAINVYPRLSIFRSNKHLYAQVIDDSKAATLCSVTEKETEKSKSTKTEIAERLGELIAKKALLIKVKKVAFDKGSYRYHGRVKAFAEGARKGGLIF